MAFRPCARGTSAAGVPQACFCAAPLLITRLVLGSLICGCSAAAPTSRGPYRSVPSLPAAFVHKAVALGTSGVPLRRSGISSSGDRPHVGYWATNGYGGTFGLLHRARLHPLQRSRSLASRTRMCYGEPAAEGGTAYAQEEESSRDEVRVGRTGCRPEGGLGGVGEGEFCIEAPFAPTGDQPEAISTLLQRLAEDCRFTVLRGATGTGKTFTMAHVINAYRRPTLLLCHNKTLAAQLARELKSYFPHNAVELFVSYYNYYQPEAYLPGQDTYIAKTTSINEELDALRHRATRALCERNDVIVVSTVSCIYGLGLPANYLDARLMLTSGDDVPMQHAWQSMRAMLYEQTDSDMQERRGGESESLRGYFQIQHHVEASDIIVWPPYQDSPTRLRFRGDRLVAISHIHRDWEEPADTLLVYPARHHVTPKQQVDEACVKIEAELEERVRELVEMVSPVLPPYLAHAAPLRSSRAYRQTLEL